MQIIPVLDLKDRMVVRARMGQRDAYRPIETPLSSTVTVPVGVPEAVTVMVKVTCWPNTDGLAEDVTFVELFPAWLTVCDSVVDTLPVKFESPE